MLIRNPTPHDPSYPRCIAFLNKLPTLRAMRLLYPDSTLIAHTMCRYGREGIRYEEGIWGGFGLEYEIEGVGIDGGEPKRLTRNDLFDSFSDCSPHPFDILAVYALYQTVG